MTEESKAGLLVATSCHWMKSRVFTVKGINRVHELIDAVHWGAAGAFARHLRKLELQKLPGDLTVSHRLLAVSSVIRNHCFGADGDQPTCARS